MAPVVHGRHQGHLTVFVALILSVELALALTGLLVWLTGPDRHPLGKLLVMLGVGAAFFTSLWIQYRRRQI